jgi:NAD(P)-dependent dehydrogenase (short-subunit alcohol dehydrogenase family)
MRFEGKTAIVTGAGSGIGRATALRLASEGASVLAVDIDAGRVEGAAAGNERITPYGCDVSDHANVVALEDEARTRFGGLDVLCNNAGIPGQAGRTHEHTPEQLEHVLAVNLRGAFYMLQAGLRLMLKSGGGAIVSTSSIAAVRGIRMAAPYVASKGALSAVTRTAALEYAADGIRVNAVAPGTVVTGIRASQTEEQLAERARTIPVGFVAQPDDIASVIAFLASDDARFITGQTYLADGGSSVDTSV